MNYVIKIELEICDKSTILQWHSFHDHWQEPCQNRALFQVYFISHARFKHPKYKVVLTLFNNNLGQVSVPRYI
jgi:hypothetical protein